MKRIAIIGTGISGLSFGYYLQKRFRNTLDLFFIEKTPQVGGHIQTFVKEGFLFENGPRGFRPEGRGEATLSLVKELNLEKELISSEKSAQKRYIYKKGKLQPFSFSYLVKNGLCTALLNDFFRNACESEDETVADFTLRCWNQKVLDYVIDPMIKGVFAGNPDKLSIRSAFPFLWQREKKKGSLLLDLFKASKKAKGPALFSFKNGMHTLIKALKENIEATFYLSNTMLKCRCNQNPILELSHTTLEVDAVVFAIPEYEIPQYLGCIPIDEEWKTITTLHLGWRKKVLPQRGFGFLVPSREKMELLGVTFDSEIFPTQNEREMTRLTAMFEGASFSLEKILHLLEIQEKPDLIESCVHKKAIPQYGLHHFSKIENFRRALPPYIFAIGNSFEGVSVNDCIYYAKKTACDWPILEIER